MTLKTRVAVALLILFGFHYDVIIKFAKTAQLSPQSDTEHLNENILANEDLVLNIDEIRDQYGHNIQERDSDQEHLRAIFDLETDVFNNDTMEQMPTKFDDSFLYFEKSIYKRDAENYDPSTNSSSDRNESFFNYTMSDEEYLDHVRLHIYPKKWTWVLICLHSIVFVIGLVGNTLVCVAVYRNHTMRTVTNYFIVNLAVADFLVILFCLPPSVVWDVTSTWFFGTAMCKIVLYLQVGVCCYLFIYLFIQLITPKETRYRSVRLHTRHDMTSRQEFDNCCQKRE